MHCTVPRESTAASAAIAMALALSFAAFPGGSAPAAEFATVADPKGITSKFPQQVELDNFERQLGKKLTFNENPMFADKVKSGKLPPVAQRLPAEPLVVMPYEEIGKYGGMLRGTSIAYESGNSEILSWRHVNMVRLLDDLRTVVPNVAKSWKWNASFSEITFKLRKGHRWSDGTLFTADDFLFYMNDIIKNTEMHKKVTKAWMVGGSAAEVEKIDDLTVKFTFAAPYPGFLHYLATSGSWFKPYAPKHLLKKYHASYNPNAEKEAKAAGFDDWVHRFGKYWNKWNDVAPSTDAGLEVPTLESHIVELLATTERRVYAANPYYFKVDTAGNQLPYIDRQHERFMNKELMLIEIINGNFAQ